MPFRPNPARCPGGKLGRKCRVRPDGGEPAIEADVYILCVCRCWGKVCHANVQLAGKVVRRKVFFLFSFPFRFLPPLQRVIKSYEFSLFRRSFCAFGRSAYFFPLLLLPRFGLGFASSWKGERECLRISTASRRFFTRVCRHLAVRDRGK